MRLLERLKQAFNPASHDATQSHYIPSLNYADEPVENSVWQSDLQRTRWMDWKGDTGRVPNSYVMTTQGPMLFALDRAIGVGLGGLGVPYGQFAQPPVAGFAGRPAQLDATSIASEYVNVQE